MLKIDENKKAEIRSRFTKYEIARILGARALQISMNAPVLVKLDAKELDDINYDPLRIAEYEFYQGILPITVKRPMPKKGKDRILAEKAAEKAEEKKKAEERKEKGEKEEIKRENLEKEEKVSERAIIEEVKDTEVMELAQPEDETDTTEEKTEEV